MIYEFKLTYQTARGNILLQTYGNANEATRAQNLLNRLRAENKLKMGPILLSSYERQEDVNPYSKSLKKIDPLSHWNQIYMTEPKIDPLAHWNRIYMKEP